MGPYQVQLLWVRVDRRVMALKVTQPPTDSFRTGTSPRDAVFILRQPLLERAVGGTLRGYKESFLSLCCIIVTQKSDAKRVGLYSFENLG